MPTEKSDLLNRLLKGPEELQQSGEDGPGNEKVKVSDWGVSVADGGRIAIGCDVTPVSTTNPISDLLIQAKPAGTDKLAALAIVTLTSFPSEKTVSISGWTGLYDPSIDGNALDSRIWGHVRVGDTDEVFNFETRLVIPT